jgi:RNA polymerase sigma-70 factor (ECF subfamily)
MGWLSDEREARCRGWMIAAQGGDGEAYERLLRELLPLLRSFVRGRVPEASAVEDVVQNVLLSVHRARHTYRSERPLGPWLRAVARNAVLDYLRSRQRRVLRELPLEAAAGVAGELALETRTRGLSPELRSALDRLPSAQREAVELIQIQGLSVAEAARRAGIKPGALKVRAHRGYRALRGLLGERGEL